MLAKVMSVGISGIDGFPVTVEVDKSGGMPGFDIVGLPDASVKESRERVKSALRNSHLEYPLGHFTINLAPADLRKEGPSFDLPIAVGVLICAGDIAQGALDDIMMAGELGLSGNVNAINGHNRARAGLQAHNAAAHQRGGGVLHTGSGRDTRVGHRRSRRISEGRAGHSPA